MYAVAGAAHVPIDDVFEYGIKLLAHEFFVAAVVEVGADGFEEPQRRVGGIVFRGLAGVRETIGKHALVNACGVGFKDLTGDVEASGDQRQTGQRDHGVAAPICEPVIAGHDGFERSALDDVLIGGGGQRPHERLVEGGGIDNSFATAAFSFAQDGGRLHV